MSTSIHVLLVDEDEDVLDLTATFLERESDVIDVEAETSARKALDRLETDDFDCVVSDYRMPEMNGLDFFRAVRQRCPSLPFVLFSGAVDEDIVAEAEDVGVTAFVTKGAGVEHYSEMASIIEDAVE